jgi:hypothetical protein
MPHLLQIGDRVDVHTNFVDSWVPGFEIVELVAEGYHVRRESDGSLLPGYTSELDVRPSAGFEEGPWWARSALTSRSHTSWE